MVGYLLRVALALHCQITNVPKANNLEDGQKHQQYWMIIYFHLPNINNQFKLANLYISISLGVFILASFA